MLQALGIPVDDDDDDDDDDDEVICPLVKLSTSFWSLLL